MKPEIKPRPEAMTSTKLTLFVVGMLSLGFISVTDRFLFNLFKDLYQPAAVIADLRLTSLAILSAFYFWIKKTNPVQSPPRIEERRRVLRLSIIWFAMTAYFVLVQKVWVPTLKDWIDIAAFMITGLIGEEILFRGILFDLSLKVFADKKILQVSMPVLLTSVLFGLQHLAYHHFALTPASITQVLYTTAMGFVFARIRESSGYLWPVIAFHMLNNFLTLIRNFS